jgi:response regulator NasT
MEVMTYAYSRWRKKMRARPRKRSKEEQDVIDRAKELLMERNGLTEEEAHRYIQKSSMDNGTGVVETAGMIMSLMLG